MVSGHDSLSKSTVLGFDDTDQHISPRPVFLQQPERQKPKTTIIGPHVVQFFRFSHVSFFVFVCVGGGVTPKTLRRRGSSSGTP